MSISSSSSRGGGDMGPLIPNLPDDIAGRCIALLPFSSYPSLSLVSRSWRSFLLSPHLFHLRSPSPVLLLSVRTPSNPSRFLLLFPNTPQNPPPLPLPSPPLPTLGSSFAPLGPALFLIGGSHSNIPTRSVQTLDLRTRLWSSSAPSMSSPREFPASAAISGRIYALGGCLPNSTSTSTWAESLDPTTDDKWTPLPGPPPHLQDKWMHGYAVLDGKLYAVADRGGVVFDPVEMTWSPVPKRLDLGWKGRAAVVGGVLYTYDYLGKIKGYDAELDQWRKVEGLDKKLPVFLCGATLASFAGLLCLVWEERGERKVEVRSRSVDGEVEVSRWRNVVDISCAGIEISKEEGGGLRGKVVWLEKAALSLPKGSGVVHCVEMVL